MESKISIPQDELHFTYARSSGAGGQNVNKVNSKAVLRWLPATSRAMPEAVRQRFMNKFGSRLNAEGELIVTSERHRDQGRNVADCLEKLKEMIASVWTAPKKRKATKPTFGSKQRRIKAKKSRGEIKAGRSWKPE
ncbi:MAG: alternative ribosome rescue aminoacyl-tRNA hydrolase ArfB [Bdellovibrionota bacterium]